MDRIGCDQGLRSELFQHPVGLAVIRVLTITERNPE